MSNDLTDPQANVLAFIQKYLAAHRYPPTLQEINKRFGWSSNNAAAGHLYGLRRKGYVNWTPGQARTLRVIEQAADGTTTGDKR